jgi:periplasmic protein TonB
MTTTPPKTTESQGPGAVVSTGWLAGQSMFSSHEEHHAKRAFGASLATIALHALFLLGAMLFFAYHVKTQQEAPPPEPIKFVYLQQPGPGGGGGGSPAPAPNKPISIPKTKAPAPVPVTPVPPSPVPPPVPTLSAPVMTTSSDLVQATGSSSVSLAAYGGGGRGGGIGSGTGSGVGPGTGGGFGGGAYRPGSGIQNPVVLKEVKPAYTSEVMRAKIQGEVTLEAVVDENGIVNDVRVVKSLDRLYGLDEEAKKAARLWVFRPARDRDNKPVPILITLVLDFRLH